MPKSEIWNTLAAPVTALLFYIILGIGTDIEKPCLEALGVFPGLEIRFCGVAAALPECRRSALRFGVDIPGPAALIAPLLVLQT